MTIEVQDGQAWIFDTRSCSELPEAPLHSVVRWVLQQLNYGCFLLEREEGGDAVTLILGKEAAIQFEDPALDTAIEHQRRRAFALSAARLFAQAREEGVEPKYADLAEQARLTAADAACMNTEFYYAFLLVDILERIRAKTFVFTCPPIKGILPQAVSRLLGEATRSYLFACTRSVVALCRAVLEASLEAVVEPGRVLQERFNTKKGELECLINVAIRDGILTSAAGQLAHRTRRSGNSALHGDAPSDDESWATLLDTRHIVEELQRRAASQPIGGDG